MKVKNFTKPFNDWCKLYLSLDCLYSKAARIWDSVSTRLDYDICKGGIRGPK